MSKVLSQEETAALLEGIADGSVETGNGVPRPPGEVHLFDFAAGHHIVRGSLPALRTINERFSRDFATALSEILRRPAAVEPQQIRTLRFSEYEQTVPAPAAVYRLTQGPLPGNSLLILDAALIYAAVDGYFGGSGRAPVGPRAPEFTRSELRIAGLLAERALEQLSDAWEPVQDLEFAIEGFESDIQFANVATGAETIVVAGFGITLGDASVGWIQLAMPSPVLAPVRERLDAMSQDDDEQSQEEWQAAFAQRLRGVELDLRCDLARTRVNLRTVLGLRPGDVIPISLPEKVSVTAAGAPVFLGRFGVSSGYNAIEMTERCAREPNPAS